jgi:hypothetical protein
MWQSAPSPLNPLVLEEPEDVVHEILKAGIKLRRVPLLICQHIERNAKHNLTKGKMQQLLNVDRCVQ